MPEPSLAPRGQYAAADADGANWDANAPTSTRRLGLQSLLDFLSSDLTSTSLASLELVVPIKYSWTTHTGIWNLPCLLSLRLEAVLPLHVYVQRFWDLYVFPAAEKNLDRKLIEFLSLISPDTSGIYMASKCLHLIVLDPLSCPTPSPKKDPSALGLDFSQGTWASFVGSTHGSLATWEPCKDQGHLPANATSLAPWRAHGSAVIWNNSI